LKKYENFELNPIDFPKLNAYIKRMHEQPEVKKVAIETEFHEKFFISLLKGEEPPYDLGTKITIIQM